MHRTKPTHAKPDGRRPIYLITLPLLGIGSVGVALAQDIPSLMTWRFLQAFGASPGLSVGAGVIGDIYRLEDRGGAMGVFFAACLLGPALAPLCGGQHLVGLLVCSNFQTGVVSHLSSWRTMQYILAAAGAAGFICMFFLFSETCHPGTRGIDRHREQVNPRARIIFVNPVRSLALLRSPNLLAVVRTIHNPSFAPLIS